VPDTPEKMGQIVDHWQQLQGRIVRRPKEA
jgi:hypothetical protein